MRATKGGDSYVGVQCNAASGKQRGQQGGGRAPAEGVGHAGVAGIRQMVLREAAVCCSMSHPNVVATYHYEVMQAAAFHGAPSGLSITDKSGSSAFKLYLIQVCPHKCHGMLAVTATMF